MIGQLVPGPGVGEVRAAPGAGDVIGEEVVRHIRPADRVVFRDARPCDAVQLAGLNRDLDILPGKRHRHDAETRQELAGGGEGEHAQALKILQAANWIFGVEVTRIPGAGAQPGHAFHFAVGLFPDLLEPVLTEQDRHVEAVASGKGKVSAEHRNIHRSCNGIVVALHGVDGAFLHRPEKLGRRHQLIGGVQLDDHLPIGHLVEGFDGGLDDVLGQWTTGISLKSPLDGRFLLRMHVRRMYRGNRCRGSHACRFEKFAFFHSIRLL